MITKYIKDLCLVRLKIVVLKFGSGSSDKSSDQQTDQAAAASVLGGLASSDGLDGLLRRGLFGRPFLDLLAWFPLLKPL